MSNTLLTISDITRELAYNLENSLMFGKSVYRGYDDKFAQTGAKIGNTLNLRMPARFLAKDGANANNQDYTESNVALTLSKRKHVNFQFTTEDMTLSMDDYSERTLKPAAIALATQIDRDISTAMAKAAYSIVGTPGTTPGAASGNGLANTAGLDVLVNAGAMLDMYSAPQDRSDRYAVFNPFGMAGVSKTLAGMYNDRGSISQIYKDGRMRDTHLGFAVGMDQNIISFTSGTRANGSIAGANQSGSSANITGAGNAATINIGDRFTIANVFTVDPVSQQSTGQLQHFVVTANATMNASGANTISFAPSIKAANANVADGTVDSLPANGAALTWLGNASTVGFNNLAYHKNAIVLGTADLDMPNSIPAEAKSRITNNGISLRVVQYYNGSNDIENCRVDVLYGIAIRRPEHIVVIGG